MSGILFVSYTHYGSYTTRSRASYYQGVRARVNLLPEELINIYSSCWVIIRNNVYDVTDFLSVRYIPLECGTS